MGTVFKSLTDTVWDSVEGYRKAAEKAESPQIKQALSEQLAKREQLLGTMNNELQRCGEELVTKGTATGALHRTWLEITDLFNSDDETAVKRVEEGEDYLAKKFEEALEHKDFDPQTRAVVEQGYQQVKEGERFADQLESQVD